MESSYFDFSTGKVTLIAIKFNIILNYNCLVPCNPFRLFMAPSVTKIFMHNFCEDARLMTLKCSRRFLESLPVFGKGKKQIHEQTAFRFFTTTLVKEKCKPQIGFVHSFKKSKTFYKISTRFSRGKSEKQRKF